MKRKILKISLVGKTNAGKSTLLNNLVGEKISITNKKINTTEDFVIGIVNIKNTQLVLYDTPGISFLRDNKSQKTKLKKNLWEGLNQSDIILYLIDSKRIELNDENLGRCKIIGRKGCKGDRGFLKIFNMLNCIFYQSRMLFCSFNLIIFGLCLPDKL